MSYTQARLQHVPRRISKDEKAFTRITDKECAFNSVTPDRLIIPRLPQRSVCAKKDFETSTPHSHNKRVLVGITLITADKRDVDTNKVENILIQRSVSD
jgi:hypothetical protein